MTTLSKLSFATLLVFISLTSSASAHQPRIPTVNPTIVEDPATSKAYYSTLMGEPHTYIITATSTFPLYVNLLVPDIAGQKKDISAVVIKDGDTEHPVVVLDGNSFEWKPFFEAFGHDSYFMGPEYKAEVGPGIYEVKVWSSNNDSKYSLVIGEAENFDFKETMNALTLVPQLKRDFFIESPIGFILSPFGAGIIVVMFVLAFMFGFAYRALMKAFTNTQTFGRSHNIGKGDRWTRAFLGLGLLTYAIFTSWSPILLFISGFCFFEAIFSWCGFFAAIGRSTCPVE